VRAHSFHFEFQVELEALVFVKHAAKTFKLPCFRQGFIVYVIATEEQVDDLVVLAKELGGKVVLP
jgi:hypothetical protein